MEPDPMRRLARSLIDTSFDNLPPEAVQATKNHLIHTLGTILAGSSTAGCGTVTKLINGWGGSPQSSILVFGSLVPAPHAALVNSVMAEAGEFQNNDDRINYKSSVCAIPAAWATAERLGGVSGKELITAVCAASTALPIPREKTERALELLEGLEMVEDVSELPKLLSPTRANGRGV